MATTTTPRRPRASGTRPSARRRPAAAARDAEDALKFRILEHVQRNPGADEPGIEHALGIAPGLCSRLVDELRRVGLIGPA